MFSSGSNSLDDLIGTKESFALEIGNRGFFSSCRNVIDYLSDKLSTLLDIEVEGSVVEATVLQLQSLLTMAGSGSMPMGIPHRHNPDDDFSSGPFGGNSAVSFEGEPLAPNPTFIVVLGNGTLVFPEDSDSI